MRVRKRYLKLSGRLPPPNEYDLIGADWPRSTEGFVRMQMSNALVVIDTKHPDQNTLNEIVEAVKDAGGKVLEIERERHVIEVLIPTREIPIVAAMGGVAYVRQVFHYETGDLPEKSEHQSAVEVESDS